MDPRIRRAEGAADLGAVRGLIRAYAASLAVDLAYQEIAAELDGLPGAYAPPGGTLLVADGPDGALGCGALRALAPARAEMKRVYVRPEARGTGLGPALVLALLGEARRLGHREIVLDTLPGMDAAQALYRRLGFRDIAPYYDTPIAGTLFLGLRLDR